MLSVLVTGGTGFIGSNMVRFLRQAGYDRIMILTRSGVIDEKYRLWSQDEHVKLIEGDVRHLEDLSGLRSVHADVVFHLAAYNQVGKSHFRHAECFRTNAIGPVNIVNAVSNCDRFVLVSSSEVYGNTGQIPICEDTPTSPVSPYGRSKLEGEQAFREAVTQRRCLGVIVRPFNTYGPYQSTRALIPEIICSAILNKPIPIRKSNTRRDFLFVTDTVAGILESTRLLSKVVPVVNLATGRSFSVREVATMVCTYLGKPAELIREGKQPRLSEIWHLEGSTNWSQHDFPWNHKIGFEKGLEITIEWYRMFVGTMSDLWEATRRILGEERDYVKIG